MNLPPKEGVGNAGCPLHPRPRVHLPIRWRLGRDRVAGPERQQDRRSHHQKNAIVAGGISMLTGMLHACSTERLRIPQDISTIGCGDSDVAELTSPP